MFEKTRCGRRNHVSHADDKCFGGNLKIILVAVESSTTGSIREGIDETSQHVDRTIGVDGVIPCVGIDVTAVYDDLAIISADADGIVCGSQLYKASRDGDAAATFEGFVSAVLAANPNTGTVDVDGVGSFYAFVLAPSTFVVFTRSENVNDGMGYVDVVSTTDAFAATGFLFDAYDAALDADEAVASDAPGILVAFSAGCLADYSGTSTGNLHNFSGGNATTAASGGKNVEHAAFDADVAFGLQSVTAKGVDVELGAAAHEDALVGMDGIRAVRGDFERGSAADEEFSFGEETSFLGLLFGLMLQTVIAECRDGICHKVALLLGQAADGCALGICELESVEDQADLLVTHHLDRAVGSGAGEFHLYLYGGRNADVSTIGLDVEVSAAACHDGLFLCKSDLDGAVEGGVFYIFAACSVDRNAFFERGVICCDVKCFEVCCAEFNLVGGQCPNGGIGLTEAFDRSLLLTPSDDKSNNGE